MSASTPPAPGSPEFEAALAWDTGESEHHVAETRDGWRIHCYRYLPTGSRRSVPAVLGHGFAGSRYIFDVSEETSLARNLAAAGFDTWLVDLRGRNASWPAAGANDELHWTFDDFVFRDIPAATDLVGAISGSDDVFWVGTEMSGIAAYAVAISETAPIRAAVTMGAPARTPPSGQIPAVNTPLPERDGTRYRFSMARDHGPTLALEHPELLESSFRAENTDWEVVGRYFRHGVPDESSMLVDQFTDWLQNDTMRSFDRSISWADRLAEITIPMLLLAGERDLQRPPEGVEATFRELGSADKEFVRAGRAAGFSTDFGHDDLIAGRDAPREIHSLVIDWLSARS